MLEEETERPAATALGSPSTGAEALPRFVSSGQLPTSRAVLETVRAAHDLCRDTREGHVSTVYPALASADPDLFGVCLVSTAGRVYEAGDARAGFAAMSVAKPFVLALVCEAVGLETVRQLVGCNATGLPFNSLEAVERTPGGRTNPMVNPGAIATTSLVPGDSLEARWQFVLDGLSAFAGHPLGLDAGVLDSASATNHRNRAAANLLASLGALAGDPADAVELYTRQSCLSVTAVDLAAMGATLADAGVHPVTGEAVVSAETAHAVLAVMTVAGMYETSGDWLLDVGMPAKSGIAGGLVCVSPGKGALGTFAPPLDRAGNSVRGQLVARHLTSSLGLDLLASAPARPGA